MRPSTASARPLGRRRLGPPRDRLRGRLLRPYAALGQRFGPQHWWPSRTPFEIAVGAILAQHTAWENVERALRALRARRLLVPRRLAALAPVARAGLIRPAGTYRVKARRLRWFVDFVQARLGGRMARLRWEELGGLRAALLAVPGLGPETADTILLYAGRRPVFVVDAYLRRVLARHRLIAPGTSSEAVRALVEAHRTRPRCRGCPLRRDLHGRPPRAI
ncbi:MAG: endonuclease [Candidatus Rokuibacteriota bacterium]|nr:MAG: endonuclease [Candidatus Rokubacteria bacterium]